MKKKKRILIWFFKEVYGFEILKNLKKKLNIYHCVNFNDPNDLPKLLSNYDFLITNYNCKKYLFNKNKFLNEIFIKFFEKWKNYFFSRFNFDDTNYLDHETIFKCQILFLHEYLTKEKINLLIMGPDWGTGSDYILYEIAKKLNIKTLLIKNTFRNRFFYVQDFEDWGLFKNIDNKNKRIVSENYINNKKVNFWYMKKKFYLQKKFGFRIFFPFFDGIPEYGLSWTLIKINISNFLKFKRNIELYKFWCREKEREFLTKKLPKNYILFALHFQPEASTMSYGNNYIDQAKAIEELSYVLPKGYSIIVKDHARQSSNLHRSDLFYKRLDSLKNVKITNVNDDIHKLMSRSKAVATITGIVGFEAIFKGKPTITFGKAWYNFMPYVYKWADKPNILNVLSTKIQKSKIEKSISDFTRKMPDGVLYAKWGENAYDFTTGFKKINFNPKIEAKIISDSLIKLIKSIT